MNGDVHMCVGAATATGMALLIPQMTVGGKETVILGVGTAIIGSLLPDIDANGESKIKKQFRKFMLFLVIALTASVIYGVQSGTLSNMLQRASGSKTVFGFILCIVLCIVGYKQPHRGFTHQLVGLLAFTFSWLLMFGYPMTYWFFFGYLSHQLVDFLNKRPIQWLYPLPGKVMLGICYADSAMAKVIGFVSLVLAFFFTMLLLNVNPDAMVQMVSK